MKIYLAIFLVLLLNTALAQNIKFENKNVNSSSLDYFGFNYSSFDSLKIRGFLIQPKLSGKYPVIIFNRGGNRTLGVVTLEMLTDFLGKIADKGFIIIGSQLRGSGQSEGKDEFGGKDVQDVVRLVDIIKTLPKADTSKIGMLGISRGVMTNFLVLKHTNIIKSCVSISGIADLNQPGRPEMETLYAQLIPDYSLDRAKALQDRSPLLAIPKIKNKQAQHFIIHGQKDERVEVSNALQLYTALCDNHIAARLQIFENDNHGINNHTEELINALIGWYKKTL